MDRPAVDSPLRADKWLWAARFYKTRSLAIRAINGGKIHVNGDRIKPARRLACGDQLSIQKGPYRFLVTVESLSRQRRPAAEARALYRETSESIAERQVLHEERRLQGHNPKTRARRPDKKARRQLRMLKR